MSFYLTRTVLFYFRGGEGEKAHFLCGREEGYGFETYVSMCVCIWSSEALTTWTTVKFDFIFGWSIITQKLLFFFYRIIS